MTSGKPEPDFVAIEHIAQIAADLAHGKVVDEAVVVEVKSTLSLHPVARRQLYNYLRATNLDVGLLLHFGPEPRFQRILMPRRLPNVGA